VRSFLRKPSLLSSRPPPSASDVIRLRGVRQNNLQGFDLDVPLGRYVVVTGLSGTGKSSLVFDTLHAEGQRRYVETFSAYTRQFLDLLNPPRVDSIENIRPSIAIEQTNTVKTSRSTVGTMTELTDYAKVWFSRVAECFDPTTGEKVEDDNPRTVWHKMAAAHSGQPVVIAFQVARPDKLTWEEILAGLKGQGYTRVLSEGPRTAAQERRGTALGDEPAGLELWRIDDLPAAGPSAALARLRPASSLFVVQDRLVVAPENQARFLEATESAMHFGRGEVHLFAEAGWAPIGHYSRGLHSPRTGRTFRAATPPLFSFNSPLGACPTCRGFGRIIEIDYRLAIPDSSLSIEAGAIKCWEGKVYGESKRDLLVFARKLKIPTNVPFAALNPEQQEYVIQGEPGYGEENGKTWPKHWYGIKGFFRYLEGKTYKMHVRVFLSRYRAYNPCPDCHGTRLQPEARCWRWRHRTLPELYQMPIDEFLPLLAETETAGAAADPADLAHESMLTRLRYLQQVGLGYLTLDRPSKTLSGGEVQRVNLTSCLGTSLVDTLFVLDEPSVGLHPRDIGRLIAIIRSLTDAGNTVVVVEHDEAMISAADQVIELGPEPGSRGGRVVFQGSIGELHRSAASITGAYLSGRETIPAAGARRAAPREWLRFSSATKHNVRQLDFRLPLRRLVCLSGVSGSGKSTLLDNVIYQGLLAQRGRLTDDPAVVGAIRSDLDFTEIVLADQAPLARTPRSNPAIYSGAWELVRGLYAETPAAQAAGFSPSSFSFNSGDGRCDHCLGLGYERVEMQFLSDVFIPCPVCEGRRFKPEVLAIARDGLSVADLLALPIADALPRFEAHPEIHRRLAALAAVGLGYLTLGQPLNTLSGGESQRLKLVKYLSGIGDETASAGALLLLDEPTTGLHRHDVKRLLGVLQTLVERGHSVVIIEHHLDVLKSADWILEIGPEAGASGGRVVAEGTPEAVAAAATATSPYLRAALAADSAGKTSRHGTPLPPQRSAPLPALPPRDLVITGARENNLKNISLTIPHHAFNVVTGVSGSGKSTLAFDIVFAEGQRRFMESMSPYARQFVEQLPRPAIDRLTGIPPTVAIEQRVTRGSRKSTVATITEVAQYLRLLYARLGVQYHPDTGQAVAAHSPGALKKLLARTLAGPRARRAKHLYLCAPLIRGRKGHHQPIATWIERHGYALMRADGKVLAVESFQKLDRYKEHDVEVVVADLKAKAGRPLSANQALDEALRIGKGSCFLLLPDGDILSWFSTTRTDIATGESFPELDPKHFSFNSPRGWCPQCRGYGRLFDSLLHADDDEELPPEVADLAADQKNSRDSARKPEAKPKGVGKNQGAPICPACGGTRLNRVARAVKLPFRGRRPALSLPELLHRTPAELLSALRMLALDPRGRLITRDIVPQIEERVKFLGRVGLGYLPLDRGTDTLSGGEAQRIRLAAQLGSNLSGVLYVLDEPSIGLHARDTERLIATLEALRGKGNTLLVVEHDEEIMAHADHIIDLGPGAGTQGGELLANATPAELRRNPSSTTGLFLARGIPHPLRGSYRPVPARGKPKRKGGAEAPGWLDLEGARYRNLRGFDLRLPLGRLILVAGPSGAGKSTLCRDLLGPALSFAIARKKSRVSGAELVRRGLWPADELPPSGASPLQELRGAQGFRSVIEVDQSPIGKTPRSTPATYLGIFDLIRQFFASLPESRMRGYTASRFSFNTTGGRCPTCEGAGRIRLEMAFMPDTYLPCDDCGGLRYGPELSDIVWKGKTVGQVLQLTFAEAAVFFDFHSQLGSVCQLMVDCGLGYLTLGQSSPTLSGGEAQRLKLVTELARGLASYRERSRGESPRNFYLLEEPTIGLHLSDCEKLIRVLHSLVDQGHTVVVIEHHLDLLAEADYIVELGPRGGPDGGELLYQGALAGLLKAKRSPTAPYLRAKLLGGAH
jgi:excinuclease ABC subunit A